MGPRARRRLFATAAVLAMASSAATGCFYDWDLPSDDAGAPGGDGASDATVDASGDGAVADGGHDGIPPLPDVSGEGPPPPLPCIEGTDKCPQGFYCKVKNDLCPAGFANGTCASGAGCNPKMDPYTQWCTCNGVMTDECSALFDGGGFRTQGCPPAPQGYYQCGYKYCLAKTVCVEYLFPEETYECVPQATCPGPDVNCTCAKDACDGGTTTAQCTDVDGGGAIVQCK